MRAFWIVIRLAGAVAILAALIAQCTLSVSFAREQGIEQFATFNALVNFFSFFTIDSNITAMLVLGLGGILLLRGVEVPPVWFRTLQICAVVYMSVTGIVYNTVLRSIELPQGQTVGWANEVFHLILPIAVVLDFLLGPGRRALPWSRVPAVLIFPIIWVVYTMLRSPIGVNPQTGVSPWYPYPFLNLEANGVGGVAIAIAVITVTFVVLAALAVLFTRRQRGAAAG